MSVTSLRSPWSASNRKVGSLTWVSSSRFNNNKCEYTCTFQYRLSNYYYIAMTPYAFAKFVCSWIKIVSDSYRLCTNSLQEPLRPFKLSSIRDLNESDDEAPNHLPGILRIASPKWRTKIMNQIRATLCSVTMSLRTMMITLTLNNAGKTAYQGTGKHLKSFRSCPWSLVDH